MGYYDTKSSGKSGDRTDKKSSASYGSSVQRRGDRKGDKEQDRQWQEREKLRKAELEFQKEKFKTQQRSRSEDQRDRAQRDRKTSRPRDQARSQVQKNPDVQSQGLPPGAEPYVAPGAEPEQPVDPSQSPKPEAPQTSISPVPEKGKRFVGKDGDWAITSVEVEGEEGSFKAENQETYDIIFMNYRNGKWVYRIKSSDNKVLKVASPDYAKLFKKVIDILDSGGKLLERMNVNEQKFRSMIRSLIKEVTKKEFETIRTNIISLMLDNPDKNGIYPTTKCFAEFDEVFDKITGNKKQSWAQQNVNEQKFRYMIQYLIKELIEEEEIDEVSQTGAIAGYQTPYAFAGKSKKQKTNHAKMKKNAEQLGYKIVGDLPDADEVYDPLRPVYEHFVHRIHTKVLKALNEGRRGKYHEFRDNGKKPHQTIGNSLMLVRKKLSEIENTIDMNLRLKNEAGVQSKNYWLRSHRAMRKIEEKLVRLLAKMKGFG